MRVSDCVGCEDFPCVDVKHGGNVLNMAKNVNLATILDVSSCTLRLNHFDVGIDFFVDDIHLP